MPFFPEGETTFRGRCSKIHQADVSLVIGIVAAIPGFGEIAWTAAGVAKILYFIFHVGFLVPLISGLDHRTTR
jgi:uncharacterized membrane protein YtjA (UPF0391 family)